MRCSESSGSAKKNSVSGAARTASVAAETTTSALFEERFISHLFEIVEQTRDGDEQYNYALIRLIVRAKKRVESLKGLG